jgi:hypothetical protein
VHMECAAFSDGVRLLIGRWNPTKYKGGIPPTLTSKIAEAEVSRAADHKCTVCHEGTATISCKEVRIFCEKIFERIMMVLVTVRTCAVNGYERAPTSSLTVMPVYQYSSSICSGTLATLAC